MVGINLLLFVLALVSALMWIGLALDTWRTRGTTRETWSRVAGLRRDRLELGQFPRPHPN